MKLSPDRARAAVACAVVALLCSAAPATAAPPLDLETLDGLTATKMMEDGKLTSVELTRAYIDRIAALNKRGPGLNAVTQLNDAALADAARLDAERASGHVRGPAHGLPVLLKDLIDVKGMYTSAGNYSLRNSFPPTDSGVAKKLRESGVVILGKVGLSEYANSFGNQPSGFGNLTGQVINALDADRNPSGSSSGSATAGAAALSMLTVGTETSGSIISPSRRQGLVGLRPTVGLVPGYGIAPIRASQDTAGPMDRTVANAALTLQSIAGHDPINDAYYENYWGPGIDPSDVVPPLPAELPDYVSALDREFVEGERIGYNNADDPQVQRAMGVLEEAGAILVERPEIEPGPLPSLSGSGEQHHAIDLYYERLGPFAPINSLLEEIADNQANEHEALKFGHSRHLAASLVDAGWDSQWYAEFSSILPIRKRLAHEAIDRMMSNDTPDDASDDFIAILGDVPQGPLAGYPRLTIPMGYDDETRATLDVSIHGNAYSERDLIGVGYVIEQGTRARLPASQVNPSMYRCADTVPAPPYAKRRDCNPDYDDLKQIVATAPEVPFSLETESAASLQDRMAAGTLTARTLTKAYLSRIALTNAEGPAIQAVRELNPSALGDAARLDAERRRGKLRGPLHGIPVLVADTIDAKGMPTTGGSIALQRSMPKRDSAIVDALEDAGAIVLGKTNVTELGGVFDADMPAGYSSLGGQVLLPSDADDSPAGSSAGSTVATAAGLAAMTVGMETSPDTAEMIAPAGVAGVVALKPTVGLVSRAGVLPVATSQDSPGPITRTVRDAAAGLETMTTGARDYVSGLSAEALAGERVAVVDDDSDTYSAAVDVVESLGATTAARPVGSPDPDPPSIVLREFERDLDAYLGGRHGPGAKSLREIIAYNESNPAEGLLYQHDELLAAEAVDLSDPATKAAYEADKAAGKVASRALIDGILDNGTPGDDGDDFAVAMVPNDSPLIGIADRAGYPLLTVPAGYGTGSAGRNPVGVTFVGRAFGEADLLAAGYALEQATNVRLAPSWTNPSMWRCVAGSTFYSPHHCHPGDLESDYPFGAPRR